MADTFLPTTRVHISAISDSWFMSKPKLDDAQKALVAAFHVFLGRGTSRSEAHLPSPATSISPGAT